MRKLVLPISHAEFEEMRKHPMRDKLNFQLLSRDNILCVFAIEDDETGQAMSFFITIVKQSAIMAQVKKDSEEMLEEIQSIIYKRK